MTHTEWYAVDGSHALGYFIVTDGAGTFARVGPQHWTRVDNTGQEIEGELPDEIRVRVPVGTTGTRVDTYRRPPEQVSEALANLIDRVRFVPGERLEAGFTDLDKANECLTSLAEAVEDLEARFEQWLMETPPTEAGAIEAYRRCFEAVRAIVGQL